MYSWSDLPREILPLIAERLTHHADFIHFGSVCNGWRSVVLENLHQLPHKLPLCFCLPHKQPLPVLIHFYEQDGASRVDFLSITDQKVFGGFQLPEASQKWICGSSHGWLVTIEIRWAQRVHLLNPLTRAQIELPSLSTFTSPFVGGKRDDDDFVSVNKVILSTKPNGRNRNECVAMALMDGASTLSFCKLGDEKWTNVVDSPVHIHDVITYKGHFYAITCRGELVSCDLVNGTRATVVAGKPSYPTLVRYLVESPSGELWQVVRQYTEGPWRTCGFVIYKLEAINESENQRTGTCISSQQKSSTSVENQRELGFRWVEVESLGDQILFVGYNSSLSLAASSYPGCKANCIYFSDFSEGHLIRIRDPDEDYEDMDFLDMGVYDLDDKSICCFERANFNSCFTMPPLWFTPNPW